MITERNSPDLVDSQEFDEYVCAALQGLLANPATYSGLALNDTEDPCLDICKAAIGHAMTTIWWKRKILAKRSVAAVKESLTTANEGKENPDV